MTWHIRRLATSAVIVSLLAVAGVNSAAQEATPTQTAHAHPAHIHLGSCDALDPNPTFMLTDVALPAAQDSAGNGAIPVERSVTTVEAPLEDLVSGGYAINVHQSVDDIATYIACGSLSGALDDDGSLVVGLGELNDSAHAGVAILTANGDQTDVSLYLAEAPAIATTSATASAETPNDSTATVVDMANLSYTPAQIDIPVGTAVTWTNSDTVPHTVTAQDRGLLQSGTLNPGDDFSQTFDEPGMIDYFCEFHAGMKGKVVVS
jgi:plastocyanin